MFDRCPRSWDRIEAYGPLGQGADLNANAVTARSQKHGATRARIVLGWHLGVSNIMITKSTHPNRMRENLTAAEIVLRGPSWTPSLRWIGVPGSAPTQPRLHSPRCRWTAAVPALSTQR